MVPTTQPIKSPPTAPHKSQMGILYSSVTSSAAILRLAIDEMEPHSWVMSCSAGLGGVEDPCGSCRIGCKMNIVCNNNDVGWNFSQWFPSRGIFKELKSFVVERGMIYVQIEWSGNGQVAFRNDCDCRFLGLVTSGLQLRRNEVTKFFHRRLGRSGVKYFTSDSL